MRIVVVASVVGQPRYRRRVERLRSLGAVVELCAFEREYLPPSSQPEVFESLGRIEQRRLRSRLGKLAAALPRLRRRLAGVDVVYALGPDMAALAWLARLGLRGRPPRLVYEVGDIHDRLFGSSLRARLLRRVDQFLARRASLLVVTSSGYRDDYFRARLGVSTRMLVIENKISPGLRAPASRRTRVPGVIRVGHFGLLRCQRSLAVLKALAQRGNGAFEIQLRGVVFGLDGLEQEAHRVPHLALGGPYRVPDDLAAMYGSVDLVWACYPYNGRPDGNWRMVRTNRFYEACLFGVPMIAQAGSVDARVVEQYGIGRGLDLSAVDRAVDALLALDPEVIEGWSSRFASLPESVYRETDEHERLLEALRA